MEKAGVEGGYEGFEDTKGVIRIHISQKNRQHKEKVEKGQATIYKTFT